MITKQDLGNARVHSMQQSQKLLAEEDRWKEIEDQLETTLKTKLISVENARYDYTKADVFSVNPMSLVWSVKFEQAQDARYFPLIETWALARGFEIKAHTIGGEKSTTTFNFN